jgi:metal-responsive CopG/Arc/MetJ family transcriptional regulator
VAKVMISIPDELLAKLDEHARRRGLTRSGLIQQLAEDELTADEGQRREAILAILAKARPYGGDSARAIRELRNSR